MAGLTLDAGALIAAERNDRAFWAFWKEASERGVVPVIPAAALAQAWRSSRQARLAQVVRACFVEPLAEGLAKAAGKLVGRARASDMVDAGVVAGAAGRGDAVLTSDPRDLRRLAAVAIGTVQVSKL
ncbi:MAG TPA: twitching motility protein PilT [Actinomycetota bacterium]